MSKSINIAKYPQGMMDVLEAVCETGKPCPIAYPDKAVAMRERFQFYGLIRALKISGHSLANKVAHITIRLTGPSKNIMMVELTDPVASDFYSRVAENHLEQSEPPKAQ